MSLILFLNVVMLLRLLSREGERRWLGLLVRCKYGGETRIWLGPMALLLAQLLALYWLFAPSWRLIGAATTLVAATGLQRGPGIKNTEAGSSGEARQVLGMLVIALAGSFLFDGIERSEWSKDFWESMAAHSLLLRKIDGDAWWNLQVMLFGLLLVTREINGVIRWTLHMIHLEPVMATTPDPATSSSVERQREKAPEEREYNAGRVIGILERYLIVVVLTAGENGYGALAFILAAKAFARFKQMDERQFAEYVLVGTLISTLAAVAVAALVGRLLEP